MSSHPHISITPGFGKTSSDRTCQLEQIEGLKSEVSLYANIL